MTIQSENISRNLFSRLSNTPPTDNAALNITSNYLSELRHEF